MRIVPQEVLLPFGMFCVRRTMIVRSLSPLFLFLTLGSASFGQDPVRLTDVTALVLRPEAGQDKGLMAGLQAAGVSTEQVERIRNLSDPGLWPSGLASDSARQANRSGIGNMVAYRVCDYATDEGLMTVVHVPMAENHQMNEELRARTDLYLITRASGVETVERTIPPPPPSKGPAWQRMPKATILKADEVYATYDLAKDPEALAMMEKKGFSRPEIEAVIFRSHERNWPEGIARFDDRYPRLSDLKRYKAFAAGTWADKVLVVIPQAANKRAKEGMRPYLDFYMVFKSSAVAVKKVKQKR